MTAKADDVVDTAGAAPGAVATPDQNSQEGSSAQPREGKGPVLLGLDQLQDLLAKARKDEKDKLYPELEKARTELKNFKQRAKELEGQLSTTQTELDGVRAGSATEFESVNRELRESREKIQKLETAIETVASDAADRVRRSELAAYRAKAIAESGIVLEELVSGSSEEDIDRAVKEAKAKESKLLARAKEEARRELSAEVPRPLSPDGTRGRSASDQLSPKNREAIARQKGSDYEKARQQLLLEAKQKAGLL